MRPPDQIDLLRETPPSGTALAPNDSLPPGGLLGLSAQIGVDIHPAKSQTSSTGTD